MVFSYSEMITESCKQLRNNRQKSIGAVKKLAVQIFSGGWGIFLEVRIFSGGWEIFLGVGDFFMALNLKKIIFL